MKTRGPGQVSRYAPPPLTPALIGGTEWEKALFNDVFEQKYKLTEYTSSSDNFSSKIRTTRTSTYEELDAALWTSQVKSERVPILRPIVATKTKRFFCNVKRKYSTHHQVD